MSAFQKKRQKHGETSEAPSFLPRKRPITTANVPARVCKKTMIESKRVCVVRKTASRKTSNKYERLAEKRISSTPVQNLLERSSVSHYLTKQPLHFHNYVVSPAKRFSILINLLFKTKLYRALKRTFTIKNIIYRLSQ